MRPLKLREHSLSGQYRLQYRYYKRGDWHTANEILTLNKAMSEIKRLTLADFWTRIVAQDTLHEHSKTGQYQVQYRRRENYLIVSGWHTRPEVYTLNAARRAFAHDVTVIMEYRIVAYRPIEF